MQFPRGGVGFLQQQQQQQQRLEQSSSRIKEDKNVGNRKRAMLNAFVVSLTVVFVILFEEISVVAMKIRRFSRNSFSSSAHVKRTFREENEEEERIPPPSGVERLQPTTSEKEEEEIVLLTEKTSAEEEKEEEEENNEDDDDDIDRNDEDKMLNGVKSNGGVYARSYAEWMVRERGNEKPRSQRRKRATSSSIFDLRGDCHEKCFNGGKCDYFSGKCDCPVGFKGSSCEDEEQTFPCSDGLELRCSHACDATRGLCVCGEGATHP